MTLRYNFDRTIKKGSTLGALWLARDKAKLDYYFNRFSNKSPTTYEEKKKFLNEFDDQVLRYYHDKRSGSTLEPITVSLKSNKKLADGIARDNLILSGLAGQFFLYMASGTGSAKASIGQHSLQAENARTDAELHPQGNILKTVGRFPTTIPNATITEFGGCDTAQDPTTFGWRSVIDDVDQQLQHVQNLTEYTGSHSEVTYSA